MIIEPSSVVTPDMQVAFCSICKEVQKHEMSTYFFICVGEHEGEIIVSTTGDFLVWERDHSGFREYPTDILKWDRRDGSEFSRLLQNGKKFYVVRERDGYIKIYKPETTRRVMW